MNDDRYDVLDRLEPLFEAPDRSFERFLRRHERKRRNQRIAAGVVGVAVFLAAISIAAVGRWGGAAPSPVDSPAPVDTLTPSGERIGFIGLPPEGLAPDALGDGDLALAFYGGVSAGQRGHLFIYADGRVIWEKFSRTPFGANEHSTGWLQQRLTSAGVELVLEEVSSTGLFAGDRQLRVLADLPCANSIELHDGDHSATLSYDGSCDLYEELASREEGKSISNLDGLLADLGSWLPASAWADPTISPYVPADFQVCYQGWLEPMGRSRILELFPPEAGDLLRDRQTVRRDSLHSVAEGEMVLVDVSDYCHMLTTQEARQLTAILERADVPLDARISDYTLAYRIKIPSRAADWVLVEFEPVFPHGEAICSGCG